MAGEIAAGNIVSGSIRGHHIGDYAGIARTALEQRVLAIDNIPLDHLRVWDARQTVLSATAASDDLAYVTGTLGTDLPSIQAGDVKASSGTRYAGFTVRLPNDYEAGETVTLRAVAGMKTTVADGSCTIDFQVYRSAEDGSVGSDICATSATTINSLTAQNKDFTITPTTLVAGDLLDVRMAVTWVDGATATAVIPRIVAIKLLSDRR